MLLAASLILQTALGDQVSRIITNETMPIICVPAAAFDGSAAGDHCAELDVTLRPGWWIGCAAAVLALTVGYDGTPTHKMIHRMLYPDDDEPPPTSCTACAARLTRPRTPTAA